MYEILLDSFCAGIGVFFVIAIYILVKLAYEERQAEICKNKQKMEENTNASSEKVSI